MGIGNRHSQHSFAQIPAVNQARSVFDRSYGAKDTYFFDYLNPVFVEEVIPGDTMNLAVKAFFRLSPQVKPLMDNLYCDWYFFFVPNRLVWDKWQRFMGEQPSPGDSTDFLLPQVNLVAVPGDLSVFDHFGVPSVDVGTVNALPFRGRNLVINEWFRDQNLQTPLTVPKTDGPDSNALYVPWKSAKPHDYFTSCLPWPQKGTAPTLNMSGEAPLMGLGLVGTIQTTAAQGAVRMSDGTTQALGTAWAIEGVGATIGAGEAAFVVDAGNAVGGFPNMRIEGDGLFFTINEFRNAIMVQSLLELDARGGTRYTEILRAHYGVISPDQRLQRPEFLSSGRSMINQHPIAQTSESTADSPQGNLAAFSTMAESGSAIGFSKSFVEHGYVLGFMRARGDVSYQQGVNRLWTRRTRYDFFWPKLQELGEQAVLNKEIYVDGTAADEEVFGYQERYAEYRYHPTEIRGQFRSNAPDTMDVWHLAQDFTSRPVLNSAFIQGNTPIRRNLVVQDGDYPDMFGDLWFDLKHVRPMRVYGVPATLGRF